MGNPSAAKTDKNPPSERNSVPVDMHTDKGVVMQADKKPSVREKLNRYKAQAEKQNEAERIVPDIDKDKAKMPEPNRQTIHKQPKNLKTEREVISMTNNFKPKTGGTNNRPKLSPEAYAEKKRAEKDAVYQMIDEAAAEIVQDSDKFKGFLDTQSRMDRYSAANALLIYQQYPQATKLKDFKDWADDGVKINKGAKSISILEPVEYTRSNGTTGISYNVKKVFDVSQTSGKRQPVPSVNRDPRALVAVMLDTAPVNVESSSELPYPNMGAFYNNDKQTLYVKRDIGDSIALCQCVAQELGHAQLALSGDAYSRKESGFKAVCIGYMLCKKYGVDTKNFAIDRIPDELKGKEPKEIRAELSDSRFAFSEINSRVSDELYRARQERSKDYER